MTIRTKLSIWFVLAALLPTVIITIFAAGDASRRFRERAIEELSEAEAIGRSELDELRRDVANTLKRALDDQRVQDFLRNVTESSEPIDDAWSFAGEIGQAPGLEFDYLDFLSEDGIVISSMEWKEYASYKHPHWERIEDLHDGSVVVGPVRVVERDFLSLRAVFRPNGLVVVGGIALDMRILSGFHISSRAQVFLLDRVSGRVLSEHLTDYESRMAAELEDKLGGQLPEDSTQISLASGDYFFRAVPLGRNNDSSSGAILLLYPRKELDEAITGLLTTFLLAAAVGIGLALILGFVIARRVASPLRQLIYGFDLVALGDFSTRIKSKRSDEFGGIFNSFNRMAEDLGELRRQLVRTERIAAWQEVARKVAHEIKNPLSPIQVSIETLQKVRERRHPDFDAIFRESTETILEEVENIRRIVQEFSEFARMPEPQMRPTNLREVCEKVVRLCSPKLGQVQLEVSLEELERANADPEQVHRMLVNLVLNALEAVGAEGMISLRLERAQELDGRWARFVVADDGPGMSAAVQEQLFTPYFTTKPKGSGLGLAIVQRIVEQHKGRINIESEEGRGTSVEVLIPV